MANEYVAQQLSGPIASETEPAAKAEFVSTEAITTYMKNLSLSSAEADVLANLGLIAGLPWPIPPIGTYENNYFTLGAASEYPKVDILKGFGTVGGVTGGLLGSVSSTAYVKCPIGVYRQLIQLVARMKIDGLTLDTVDTLIHIFTSNYVLSWNDDKDLVATFSPALDTASLYTLNLILNKFMISPRVILVQSS